jgi:hypothetical protein
MMIMMLVAAAWAQQEVSVSRQAPAMIIEAGGYVSYDVTVTNAGDAARPEGVVEARFASAGGKSDSHAEFRVPALLPGHSKQLHVGPFKVAEAGEHFLHLDGKPADSFVAYGRGTGYSILAGLALAGAGAALLVVRYIRRRT